MYSVHWKHLGAAGKNVGMGNFVLYNQYYHPARYSVMSKVLKKGEMTQILFTLNTNTLLHISLKVPLLEKMSDAKALVLTD